VELIMLLKLISLKVMIYNF